MKLYTSISPQLLLGACCLLGSIHVNAATTAKCNADNCLRAMFPTNSPAQLSTASAFCATYTSGINTATTGFPTRAAAACSSSPSRFSSVCLCQPKPTTTATTPSTTTTTSTTTPTCGNTGIVKNGGFECGIAPWQPAATPGTSYSITSPGYSGQYAFEVDQLLVADTSTGREQASINQDVTLSPNTNYILTFRSYFNRGDAGFIGVMIDHQPVYTVDAEDFNGPLVWNSNSITFSASNAITNVRIEFLFGAVGSVDKIDDVSIVPQAVAP